MLGRYIWNLLIAFDQLGNAILGGDPDETISSRIGKNPKLTFLHKFFYWFLDKLDPNHCDDAIEKDEGQDKILD